MIEPKIRIIATKGVDFPTGTHGYKLRGQISTLSYVDNQWLLDFEIAEVVEEKRDDEMHKLQEAGKIGQLNLASANMSGLPTQTVQKISSDLEKLGYDTLTGRVLNYSFSTDNVEDGPDRYRVTLWFERANPGQGKVT